MTGHPAAICVVAILVAGVFSVPSSAAAQTFESYRCADGTSFIVGFYQSDSRAFLQVDGRAVTLKKRLGLSGARYSGSGVTLVIGKERTTIRHVKRPVTACELTRERAESKNEKGSKQFRSTLFYSLIPKLGEVAHHASNGIQCSRACLDS